MINLANDACTECIGGRQLRLQFSQAMFVFHRTVEIDF